MQAVFSMSQLQYFQLSTTVELYKKNQEKQKFCPLALIFHLAPYLIFIAVLKSTYPERMVLVTQYKEIYIYYSSAFSYIFFTLVHFFGINVSFRDDFLTMCLQAGSRAVMTRSCIFDKYF